MKVEINNTMFLEEHKADVEKINRIQKDLWKLANNFGICVRDESRINVFSNFLESYKTDLLETIADIEEPEKKHYFTRIGMNEKQ